jgi:hypothetical protein
LAIFVSFAAAQNSTNSTTDGWGGCVFPNDPTKSTKVKIGEPTPVCITVGPGGSWAAGVPYIRWVFTPNADQYSYFRIPDSYQEIINVNGTFQGRNLTVFTASQDILSFLRVYYDLVEARIFPYLTAIINVNGGIVEGIAWDNACVFCAPNLCLENTYNFDGVLQTQESLAGQSKGCYLSKEECDNIQVQKDKECTSDGECRDNSKDCNCENTCDVRVYVVWTGTDVDGKPFQSSSSRFSAFPAQRIQDRIQSILPPLPEFPDIPGITRRNN